MLFANNSIGQVTTDYLDYVLDVIEPVFNKEYGIFHENVLVLVDSNHNIELTSIRNHSRILNYDLLLFSEVLPTKSKLLCKKNNLLLIQFKKAHFSDIKPNLFVPEMIIFSSNGSQSQNLSGTLFPSYFIEKDKVIYTKPISFSICEFDLE